VWSGTCTSPPAWLADGNHFPQNSYVDDPPILMTVDDCLAKLGGVIGRTRFLEILNQLRGGPPPKRRRVLLTMDEPHSRARPAAHNPLEEKQHAPSRTSRVVERHGTETLYLRGTVRGRTIFRVRERLILDLQKKRGRR
jgi:hypothetical protein